MIKGKMKIEVTDVHTGETQTVLEHNMVTNALREIFKPLGLVKSPNYAMNSWAPYYQKLLGGILLFDTNIEENADNLYPPASAKMIGCAAYGLQNNTTGTARGGYNQTESELNLQNHYMKYVYDFATSQANGTIACVCLTHLNGGFGSYGSEDAVFTSSYPLGVRVDDGQLQYVYTNYTGATTGDKYSGMTVGKTECLFAIDRERDILYYFCIDNSTTIRIIKRRAYLQSVSVLENPYNQKALIEEEDATLGTEVATNYIAYNFDTADNALYVFTSGAYYIKPGETFMVTKLDFNTWAVQQYSMVNTTDLNIATNGMRFAFAHHGFVYLKNYSSPYDVYKFEIDNAANVTKLKNTGATTIPGVPQMGINGRIYYENSNSNSNSYDMYVANESTNELLRSETSRIYNSNNYYCYTPVLNEPMLFYCSMGSSSTAGFFVMANYLATINNLSEPVTKTADKTMKITYIIQEQ
ncbi:MAG: hypothetical protein PHN80_08485 [Hespellia sp.]|nr:hypothetical protein [Hespellia sp.]